MLGAFFLSLALTISPCLALFMLGVYRSVALGYVKNYHWVGEELPRFCPAFVGGACGDGESIRSFDGVIRTLIRRIH